MTISGSRVWIAGYGELLGDKAKKNYSGLESEGTQFEYFKYHGAQCYSRAINRTLRSAHYTRDYEYGKQGWSGSVWMRTPTLSSFDGYTNCWTILNSNGGASFGTDGDKKLGVAPLMAFK